MTSIILSTICAAALSAAALPASVDTTDVYVIDYVEVKDFNGSQLVGKTVSTYNINLSKEGSNIVRTHIIKTVLSGNAAEVAVREMSPGIASLIPLNQEEMGNAVFFLNGARVSELTLRFLDAENIADVKAMKGAEAAEYLRSLKAERKYDGVTDGRNVLIITTKSRN